MARLEIRLLRALCCCCRSRCSTSAAGIFVALSQLMCRQPTCHLAFPACINCPALHVPCAEGGDSVRLLDEQTFELLDRLQLQQYELACSVCRWEPMRQPVSKLPVCSGFVSSVCGWEPMLSALDVW